MSFEYPRVNIRHLGHINVIEYARKCDSACVRYTSGERNACKAKETNFCANIRTTILNWWRGVISNQASPKNLLFVVKAETKKQNGVIVRDFIVRCTLHPSSPDLSYIYMHASVSYFSQSLKAHSDPKTSLCSDSYTGKNKSKEKKPLQDGLSFSLDNKTIHQIRTLCLPAACWSTNIYRLVLDKDRCTRGTDSLKYFQPGDDVTFPLWWESFRRSRLKPPEAPLLRELFHCEICRVNLCETGEWIIVK